MKNYYMDILENSHQNIMNLGNAILKQGYLSRDQDDREVNGTVIHIDKCNSFKGCIVFLNEGIFYTDIK